MSIHIKKSHEGELHKELGVKKGEKIPEKKIEKAEHSKNPAERKRAVFAENARHWRHSEHMHHGRGATEASRKVSERHSTKH